jgi:hypothetical protein
MVAMIMVLGFAGLAAAEIELSGDARVRGIYQGNFDFDDSTDDDSRYYDHRIRLRINGSNDDGAGVKLQWTAAEENFDESQALPGGPNPYTIRYDGDDHAYMYLPVADNWTLSAGFMPANWGHKFWAWGQSKQRVKIVGKLDVAVVGFFTEKVIETYGTNDLEDYDANVVFAITKLGEFKVGGIFVLQQDKVNDLDGNKLDIFFAGKAGDISLAGEFATNMGEKNETADGDSPMGLFVSGSMDLDALKLSGAFAMTQNAYSANKFFMPTALIGTAQPTAVANLGDFGDTMAVVLGVGTKLSDEMSIGGKVMYAMWDNYPDDGDGGNLIEIDLNFDYALGEVTKFSFVFAHGTPDDDQGDPDSVQAAAWTISTKF